MPQQSSSFPKLFASAANGDTAVPGVGDYPWILLAGSTISLTGGTTFTLPPGHVYLLQADMSSFNNGANDSVNMVWVDASDNSMIGSQDAQVNLLPELSNSTLTNGPTQRVIVDLRRATDNFQVKFRAQIVVGNSAFVAGNCTLHQLS